jgi:hypothetical protein
VVFSRRQRCEQYLTSSQFFDHFRRQANGRPHVAHSLVRKSPFLTIFGMFCSYSASSTITRIYPRWPASNFVRKNEALLLFAFTQCVPGACQDAWIWASR